MGPLASVALATVAVLLGGCGSSGSEHAHAGIPSTLLAQARPIGRGPRFHPPARGAVVGACRSRPGARDGAHVEVFAQNRVLLLAAGIGTLPPRKTFAGHITAARCYGSLITLDPTGLVLVRAGAKLDVADLFRSWGQPLSRTRLASFTAPAGAQVEVFVDGRRWGGAPGDVPLSWHSEIVLEVGPHVPPHASYRFPPGT
jgi:hypothetical protein